MYVIILTLELTYETFTVGDLLNRRRTQTQRTLVVRFQYVAVRMHDGLSREMIEVASFVQFLLTLFDCCRHLRMVSALRQRHELGEILSKAVHCRQQHGKRVSK